MGSTGVSESKSRSRTPPPRSGDGGGDAGELGQKFDDMWANLEPKLDTFKDGVKSAVKTMVCQEIAALETRMEKRFDESKAETKDVKEAVARIEKMLAKSTSVPVLPNGADVDSSSPAPPPPRSYAAAASSGDRAPFPGPPVAPRRTVNISPDELNASKFWRRPDETILFANTADNKNVELSKWKASFSALAAEADLGPNLFKVTGDPLGSRIEVKFLGEEEFAARCARQLVDSLKLGGGKHKEQSVLSPDKVNIQYYINPDKPPCQVRKEILGKALLGLFKTAKPETTFTLQRAEAKIWANKRPLCSVKVLSEGDARLSWEESRRIGLNIELEQIEPDFAKVVLERGEKWT